MANLQYSPVEGGGTGGAPESGGSENRTDRNLNNLLLQAPLDSKSYQRRRVRIPNLNQRVKDFGGVRGAILYYRPPSIVCGNL